MAAHRIIAALCITIAICLAALVLAPAVDAHPGHKVGPVCTVKQAKAHPKKCVVIKVPGAPALPIPITAAPLPK